MKSDSADLHAVVLAGGRGTRLRPFTTSLPKPLVPIGDEMAIIEVILRQLAQQGFRTVTVAIGHLGQLIQAYVSDGSQWGLKVDYQQEDEPLGTMGPVARMLPRLPPSFVVMNGDVLTDLPYADLLDTHRESGAPISVATYRRDLHVDFGVLDVEAGLIVGFSEKPVLKYSVSMGVYAVSRSALEGVPPHQVYGFDDLMHDLLGAGLKPASYPWHGYWLDIGRPDDFDRANAEFSQLRPILLRND